MSINTSSADDRPVPVLSEMVSGSQDPLGDALPLPTLPPESAGDAKAEAPDDTDQLLPPSVRAEGVQAADTQKPELVVALVSALGTSVEPVTEALTSAFRTVGYTTQLVRVSDLLARAHNESQAVKVAMSASRARWLMDLGDRIRQDTRLPEAACALAIATIRWRRRHDAIAAGKDPADQRTVNEDRYGVVTIIRSLKRSEEIALLESVYGARLLVIAVSSSEEARREALLDRLRRDHPGFAEHRYASEATDLLLRDQEGREEDRSDNKYGQAVRKAFSKADAFLWMRPGRSPAKQVERLVHAWFGEPFTTPTLDEQAMFHADAAKFRSAAAGRQVGVAVVDAQGEVLVTGTNDVPRPGGGQYWPDSVPDHRDFTLEFEMNDRLKMDVTIDVLHRLKESGWLGGPDVVGKNMHELVSDALGEDGPLAESRVADLLEFGRIMHAEMAAICTAARRGTPLLGATLYTTTYPCHQCARLIIGSGIQKVVYIDPYPKSQVQRMYTNQVTDDADSTDPKQVKFVPFEGVSPRLFQEAFLMHKRDREADGTFKAWIPAALAVRVPDLARPLFNESGGLRNFQKAYRLSGWVPSGV